jgi:ribosomal protein S6
MTEVIENNKKHYEVGFLVQSEDSAPEVAALLKRYSAEITTEGTLRRIHLAYKIKKEISAVFGFFQFMAEPEQAKKLEQDLRTNSLFIRSLIIKLPKVSKKQKQSDASRAARPQVTRPAPELKPAPSLSNEALEKKIEEILK